MPSGLQNLIRNIIARKIEFALKGNVEVLPPSIENEIKTPEFPEIFKNWNDVDDWREIQTLCDNGVIILQYCAHQKNDSFASEYLINFVKKLHEKLVADFDFDNHPDRFHWTEVSKCITRFLAIFISLAHFENSKEVKRSICHDIIDKMTPSMNPKLPWTYKSSDTIISLSLPRIFTKFMYDEESLRIEVKDYILLLIYEQYENLHNNQELRDNFEYYEFYDNLYRYYTNALKDTRLLNYRKKFDNNND